MGFIALEEMGPIGIGTNRIHSIYCLGGPLLRGGGRGAGGSFACKRRKLLTGVGVVPPEVQQQRAFIAITQTGEQVVGKWKERTVYRVAARRWVCNLDNQVSRSTSFRGLAHFILNDVQGQWENRSWRC